MDSKKKFLSIYYMFLLVALFVISLGLFSNCFAMTIDKDFIIEGINLAGENHSPVLSATNETLSDNVANTLIDIAQDYENIYFFSNNSYSYMEILMFNGRISFNRLINGFLVEPSLENGWANAKYITLSFGNSISIRSNGTTSSTYLIENKTARLCPLYSNTSYTTIYWDSNLELITNTIELISASNHKFGFTDKNQLQVNFTGDWSPADFTFYVERYIDNEWQQFSDSNDYYELIDFENPYYIFWPNINYYPVGTYRYCADYGNLHEQLFYSQSFDITSMTIDTPVEGNVDSNGNIDINIDNGNVVDNIKDFMGTEPNFDNIDITQDDIENALNIEETVSPYSNVVTLFVNGLTDALLSTGESSDFVFQVHTWGQTFTVHPSDVIPQYGQGLSQFMRTMSVIVFGWIIIKWAQQISETLSVADFSKTLELVEEKYSNLL